MIHAEGSDLNPGHIRGVRARSHHCARTLALYKQENDGLLWGAITLINCLLINFFCYYSRIQPFSLFYL